MWSELPYHLVELIMDKLAMTTHTTDDYIRYGAVCTSWRDVFIHHSHPLLLRNHRLGLPPLLIVPTPPSISSSKKKKNKRKQNTKSISFYNIIHRKIYNDQFQLTIPSNTHFRGSSHGWLVAVDQGDDDCQVRLFNPFTNNSIILPSTKNLPFDHDSYCNSDLSSPWWPDHHSKKKSVHSSPSTYAYLRKAVLSDDPLSNPTDYIVMAIFGGSGSLAFYKPTGCRRDIDEKWTLVEIESSSKYSHQFHDVMFYEGKFMALDSYGAVLFFDPTLNMKVIKETSPPPPPHGLMLFPGLMYLVEASGLLLQVQRFMQVGVYDRVTKRKCYKTSTFRVLIFQKNTTKEEGIDRFQWIELKSLGTHTLFLGNSDTMCICAPAGCKPNSIYFADDNMDFYYGDKSNGPHDLGVFNLEDETIENHYPTDHYTPIWPIPIWIQPSIYKRGGGKGIHNN